MKTTLDATQAGDAAPAEGSWLRTLNPNEKRTLAASFSGYAVDAFDYYTLPLVTPILLSLWGMSKTEVGLIGTATLAASAIGGWVAGILADRYGRVRILQLTILVFAIFTFACGLAQTPEQLLVARTLQGLGFGGEWAVGSVLIAEMIRPAYRGKAVGLVQSSWAVGWGAAVLVSMALFSFLPPEYSWRAMFMLGLLPALLIVFIRRSIRDPEIYVQSRAAVARGERSGNFLAIFKPGMLGTTVLASLLFTGMQGGYYAIGVWLPTFLKNERHLTVLSSGGYQFMFIIGAFIGYLCGAYLSDRLGRRRAFILFAVGAGSLVYAYTLLPITDGLMLLLGFPLGFFMSGIFSGAGAFLAELFPNELRGSGQGFCYNFGRGIGATFPALVGVLSDRMHLSLGTAIGVCAAVAYAMVVIVALCLPETRGRDLRQN
ncbi:MFS family permease [Variovorax paradoxus]|uniref:MFS family permease n=1 Tax=Variovorax paradoxus TaxID=34073 RepID=A0AAE3Y2F0_VARPD|nr:MULTISPECIES: MFS transporter [Variovorax]MBD9664305.1 MFS transporter [Variovorax sp. VRV01]MDP9965249.1 MFS family permease [Variovorax paradoxus]MDR6428317.1 MFS family permease [Variovorax paradoxus]MDR6454969.1 MFS family permease [Variovorax paradoxus]